MRNITKGILATLAIGLASFNAQAQRSIDVAINEISVPADNAVIANGETVNITFQVANLGPDTFHNGDSLFFDGSLLSVPSGQIIAAPLSQAFAPGQGANISDPNLVYVNNRTAATDTVIQLCVKVYGSNPSNTSPSIVDPNLGNNEKCVSVTLRGANSSSILNNRDNVVKTEAFPNPTTGEVSIVVNNTKSGNVIANVNDLTGRTVYTQTFQNQTLGNNTFKVNLAGLATGTYMIELQLADGKKAISKVVLQ